MLRLTETTTSRPWTPEEISEVESLSDQISNTLESARLYNEAQQRAVREQTVSEIAKNITSATEVDDIMRETVTQLGKTLPDVEVTLRIKSQWEDKRI
jgi:hypothetical protein